MRNLITKIIITGLVLGAVGFVFVMFLGLGAYYLLQAADVMVFPSFMEKVAITALIAGIIICASWYLYLLIIAKTYFFKTITEIKQKEKK